MEGKVALVLGVANQVEHRPRHRPSLYSRRRASDPDLPGRSPKTNRGGTGRRAQGARRCLPCDVTQDAQLDALANILANDLKGRGMVLNAVVHSIAFANREDLSRPFVETSRAGFALAQDVSAYSLVAVARATAPLMAPPGQDDKPGGGSIMTLDLPWIYARGGTLQRDGRRQSVARSFRPVPGGRPWARLTFG